VSDGPAEPFAEGVPNESGDVADQLAGGAESAESSGIPPLSRPVNLAADQGAAESATLGEVDGAVVGPDSTAALAERTADLQRLQAEYLNYKRRVERDRDLVRENATYAVLVPIVDVLDTIDRAREHGPLEGGFQSVAEQLERVVVGLGLTKFGAAGDAFDPTIHEALSHIGEDPEVAVTTCQVVAKSGYRIGDRVVRAAQVLVVDPATSAEVATDSSETD
jgi:molecular chaperone GrpE